MADVLSTSPSPTFSAPRSPSQAAFHARPYHVSRRVSSEHRSPRLQHPVSDLRPSTSTTRPPKAAAASPQARVQTTDAATQYTPPDLPPTAQQSARPAHSGVTAPLAREPAKRRASSSAEDAVTDPPEPDPRLDPQPAYQHDANGTGNGPAVAQPAPPQPSSHAESSSAAKRARPPSPADRVMPIKYETCDVKELGVLISDMLMELVRLNDGIPLKDGQLTRFHSRAPPGISVRDYLNRLIVHATLSPPILLSMVYYIDRLCVLYPIFTISSLTVHRFLISAATVAAKGLSDSFWTNSTYARVGGVSVRELALLELELLQKLEWRIVPKPEVLVDYYRSLVERSEGFVLEKEEVKGPDLP